MQNLAVYMLLVTAFLQALPEIELVQIVCGKSNGSTQAQRFIQNGSIGKSLVICQNRVIVGPGLVLSLIHI